MAKVTPCFENGNVAIVPKMVHYCGYGSSELFVYRCNEEKLKSRLLLYYMLSAGFVSAGVSSMTGTGGLRRVSPTFARNVRIPLPPLAEQRAIVSYLDSKVGQIDTYVAKQTQQIELLKELKQAVIANAVTKGIGKNSRKPSGVSWLGDVPDHWKLRKIKYVFAERSEKGYPEEPVLCSTQKYGVIPQHMYESRVVVVNKGLEGLKLVRKGDFVISLRSFQGGIEYAHYQGIISAAYTILKLNDGFDAEYIKYLMKSYNFIQLLQTCVTGIREGQNINYSLLKKNLLPIPPLSEQRAIVSYIEAKTASINKLIDAYEQQVERVKEYKQRLISDAVTGKMNVTDEQTQTN